MAAEVEYYIYFRSISEANPNLLKKQTKLHLINLAANIVDGYIWQNDVFALHQQNCSSLDCEILQIVPFLLFHLCMWPPMAVHYMCTTTDVCLCMAMYGNVCMAMYVWQCMYGNVCMAMYVWLCMYGYVCMAIYVWLCMAIYVWLSMCLLFESLFYQIGVRQNRITHIPKTSTCLYFQQWYSGTRLYAGALLTKHSI